MGTITNSASAAPLGLVNLVATQVPLTLKAASAQSADLMQWQSSTGSLLGRIDSNGFASLAQVSGVNWVSGSYLLFGQTGPVTNRIWDAATVGFVVKAASAQSADLMQWQSSTAALLAKVDKSGAIAPQNGARLTSGSGAPTTPGSVNPSAGDVYFRVDGGGAAASNVYVCTSGGATPTWVGIA